MKFIFTQFRKTNYIRRQLKPVSTKLIRNANNFRKKCGHFDLEDLK